jgi:hypothetical protein
MGGIYAMQSFPDFTICQFGDAWKHRDPGALFRKDLAPLAANIPYFDYMASGGKQGAPPTKTNAAYPQSGFYFFRSDWTRDAVLMALKCGATAHWQNQPDNGTFEIYAYGRNLMNDSGLLVKTLPLAGPVAMEKEEGWISYDIRRKESRPAWSWKIEKNASDPRASFLTILIPFREEQLPTKVDASVAEQGGIRTFRTEVAGIARLIRVDLAAGTAVISTPR